MFRSGGGRGSWLRGHVDTITNFSVLPLLLSLSSSRRDVIPPYMRLFSCPSSTSPPHPFTQSFSRSGISMTLVLHMFSTRWCNFMTKLTRELQWHDAISAALMRKKRKMGVSLQGQIQFNHAKRKLVGVFHVRCLLLMDGGTRLHFRR